MIYRERCERCGWVGYRPEAEGKQPRACPHCDSPEVNVLAISDRRQAPR